MQASGLRGGLPGGGNLFPGSQAIEAVAEVNDVRHGDNHTAEHILLVISHAAKAAQVIIHPENVAEEGLQIVAEIVIGGLGVLRRLLHADQPGDVFHG